MEEDDVYGIVVMDFLAEKVYLTDPKDGQTLAAATDQLMQLWEERVASLLCGAQVLEDGAAVWPCRRLPTTLFYPQQNDFDSGVYVVTILYFIVQECAAYFSEHDMVRLRSTYAYWLLNEELPL